MGVTRPEGEVIQEKSARLRLDAGVYGSVPDGTGLLIAYLVILFAIPARLIVQPLGTIGSPATLMTMLIAFWWLWVSIRMGQGVTRGINPVRRAALILISIAVLVYANGVSRPMPLPEITSADSAIVRFVALIALSLTVVDTVRSVERFKRLMDVIVIVGAVICALGLVQVVTGSLIVDNIVVPGLTDVSVYGVLDFRSARVRPVGTSTHAIELGAIMAMILPMALARAKIATRKRWVWWGISLLIALSTLLSISRTALIGSAVGVLIIAGGWSLKERLVTALAGAWLLLISAAAFPGVLGTIRGLFQNIGNDSSVDSRTDSYGVAFEFVKTNPWLGRGYGTFTPEYWILDNMYLQFTIEMGIIGLISLLWLISRAIFGGFRAAQRWDDPEMSELTRAIVGAVGAGAVTLAFFDTFAFPQSAGLLLLCIGMCGASLQMCRQERHARQTPRGRRVEPSGSCLKSVNGWPSSVVSR